MPVWVCTCRLTREHCSFSGPPVYPVPAAPFGWPVDRKHTTLISVADKHTPRSVYILKGSARMQKCALTLRRTNLFWVSPPNWPVNRCWAQLGGGSGQRKSWDPATEHGRGQALFLCAKPQWEPLFKAGKISNKYQKATEENQWSLQFLNPSLKFLNVKFIKNRLMMHSVMECYYCAYDYSNCPCWIFFHRLSLLNFFLSTCT